MKKPKKTTTKTTTTVHLSIYSSYETHLKGKSQIHNNALLFNQRVNIHTHTHNPHPTHCTKTNAETSLTHHTHTHTDWLYYSFAATNKFPLPFGIHPTLPHSASLVAQQSPLRRLPSVSPVNRHLAVCPEIGGNPTMCQHPYILATVIRQPIFYSITHKTLPLY